MAFVRSILDTHPNSDAHLTPNNTRVTGEYNFYPWEKCMQNMAGRGLLPLNHHQDQNITWQSRWVYVTKRWKASQHWITKPFISESQGNMLIILLQSFLHSNHSVKYILRSLSENETCSTVKKSQGRELYTERQILNLPFSYFNLT